jgi:hypothetical protein
MMSDYLEKEANVRLAWELTGAKDSGGRGIGFVRVKRTQNSLYKAFGAKGNLVFVIAAGLVLVVTGFWMVIPLFGQPKKDRERPGRPLRERFLAEGSFLKKFGALETYLEAYIREIQFKSRLGGGSGVSGAETQARQLAQRCGMDEQSVREALTLRRGIRLRKFIRQRKILETLWESL